MNHPDLIQPAPIASRATYKILALDVDGTLLDRDGLLRPSTAEAVARASLAGIRPVLCTGRRFRRALPVARQLGLDAPLVCNSGSIVKDPMNRQTLWRAEFDTPLLVEVVALFREQGEPVVSFTDRADHEPDFLVEQSPTGRPLFDDYLARNEGHVGVERGWTSHPDRLGHPHFHLCAIGTHEAMLEFERLVIGRFGDRVQTFVQKSRMYAGAMCEVLRRDAGKWAAILHLAALWGVSSTEVVAVGDDMNDLPMIAGAGLGVAMGHAPDVVRNAADLITGDHDNDGVAMLVDGVLLAS